MASPDPVSLDGYELQYRYEDGGEVVLSFYDGLVKCKWLKGPMTGTKQDDLPYQIQAIDEQVFLVRWHNVDAGSFVTLYIDLAGKRIFGSALIGYRSEEPVELFDSATITRIDG
ncbi:MAG: hypothetical protein AAGG11_09470, partial [Pseudomonadota bacterium]